MADRNIYVSTAQSRKSTSWKNRSIPWNLLVVKCSNTQYTGETYAEYKAMSKEDQSNRKDIGGFVGGYLADGKRKKGHVTLRDILTLDIDYAKADTWDEYVSNVGCEAFVYSTHTHTEKNPRLRLVVLLSRSVTCEEYQAIARYTASKVGMDLFDDTTYEPERLMFWPSTPKGGSFFFRHHQGDAMNADAILATYHDWRDTSEWPCSSRVAEVIRISAKKQGDPREKGGLVGAFCRCYDIHEAIEEYLSDEYERCGDANRYTYTKGTAAAGLVIYEDGLFAYSHNATDPCSMHLVNAFDLVRMHKFGHEDEDISDTSKITSMPSYKSMCQLASKDDKVRRLLLEEKKASAKEDFKNLHTEEDNDEWKSLLDYTKKGEVCSTIKNARIVLENDAELRGRLWRNDFSGQDSYDGSMPWTVGKPSGIWTNSDDCCLRAWMEENYGITGKDRISDALTAVMNAHRKHPVRDYLDSLTWDGEERLDSMLIDFLGAEDTELVRAQTRKQFTAAVARVRRPGCKYDYAMVITGHEGIGKSTLLSRMGMKWFNDSVVTLDGKEGMESLRKSWIIELGELIGIKKSEVESVKQYLSRCTDKYRPAYGKREEEYPRQCVFFGTTNERNFLKGLDGNRRFWVIEAGIQKPTMNVFKDLTPEYRDQLWAEADTRYERGEKLHLPYHLEQQARDKQEEYNELACDERIGIIQQFLDTLLPADWETRSIERRRAFFRQTDPLCSDGVTRRETISAVEILSECFGQSIDEKSKYKTREINELMKKMPGWERDGWKRTSQYGLQRMWQRSKVEDKDENLLDKI